MNHHIRLPTHDSLDHAGTQHARIDALLDAVSNATPCDDPAVLQRAWSELELAILRHFEFEETVVFPVIEDELPSTVARLRDEHRRIRDLVCGLGVSTDLHTLVPRTVAELTELFRVHHASEEMTIYPLLRARAADDSLRASAR